MKIAATISAVLLAIGLFNIAAHATTIWTGPPVTFTKLDNGDWQLPQNQDRLTSHVWITRKGTQGIYNIQQETGYAHGVSPKGTAWAYGSAANWTSLTFQPWETWAAHDPPLTVGRPAVMHLLAEDIYLDVKFLYWSSGHGDGGGGFSYVRSSIPEPSGLALLGAGAIGLLGRARRRP